MAHYLLKKRIQLQMKEKLSKEQQESSRAKSEQSPDTSTDTAGTLKATDAQPYSFKLNAVDTNPEVQHLSDTSEIPKSKQTILDQQLSVSDSEHLGFKSSSKKFNEELDVSKTHISDAKSQQNISISQPSNLKQQHQSPNLDSQTLTSELIKSIKQQHRPYRQSPPSQTSQPYSFKARDQPYHPQSKHSQNSYQQYNNLPKSTHFRAANPVPQNHPRSSQSITHPSDLYQRSPKTNVPFSNPSTHISNRHHHSAPEHNSHQRSRSHSTTNAHIQSSFHTSQQHRHSAQFPVPNPHQSSALNLTIPSQYSQHSGPAISYTHSVAQSSGHSSGPQRSGDRAPGPSRPGLSHRHPIVAAVHPIQIRQEPQGALDFSQPRQPQRSEHEEKGELINNIVTLLKDNLSNRMFGLQNMNKEDLSQCLNLLSRDTTGSLPVEIIMQMASGEKRSSDGRTETTPQPHLEDITNGRSEAALSAKAMHQEGGMATSSHWAKPATMVHSQPFSKSVDAVHSQPSSSVGPPHGLVPTSQGQYLPYPHPAKAHGPMISLGNHGNPSSQSGSSSQDAAATAWDNLARDAGKHTMDFSMKQQHQTSAREPIVDDPRASNHGDHNHRNQESVNDWLNKSSPEGFKHYHRSDSNDWPNNTPWPSDRKLYPDQPSGMGHPAHSMPAQHTSISSSCDPPAPRQRKRRNTSTSEVLIGTEGTPVTSSGRNKGQGKINEPKFECQVCGDVAAGFHCGAYVCEACKKFYLRCLKNDSNLLTCPKTQQCTIVKDNRSHCQYCRYQKCITLGMYRPGREVEKQLKVNFRAIPCKICSAPSSGFHFGAITCEGCKGFFRRMLKENLHQKFTCSSGSQCEITSANRTFCKACRFNKCMQVGMKLEGTRLGRQSNSVKRNTLIAHQLEAHLEGAEGPPAKIVIKEEPLDDDYNPTHQDTTEHGPPALLRLDLTRSHETMRSLDIPLTSSPPETPTTQGVPTSMGHSPPSMSHNRMDQFNSPRISPGGKNLQALASKVHGMTPERHIPLSSGAREALPELDDVTLEDIEDVDFDPSFLEIGGSPLGNHEMALKGKGHPNHPKGKHQKGKGKGKADPNVHRPELYTPQPRSQGHKNIHALSSPQDQNEDMINDSGHVLDLHRSREISGLQRPGDISGLQRPGEDAGLQRPGELSWPHRPGEFSGPLRPEEMARLQRQREIPMSHRPGETSQSQRSGEFSHLQRQGEISGSQRPGDIPGLLRPGEFSGPQRPREISRLHTPVEISQSQRQEEIPALQRPREISGSHGQREIPGTFRPDEHSSSYRPRENSVSHRPPGEIPGSHRLGENPGSQRPVLENYGLQRPRDAPQESHRQHEIPTPHRESDTPQDIPSTSHRSWDIPASEQSCPRTQSHQSATRSATNGVLHFQPSVSSQQPPAPPTPPTHPNTHVVPVSKVTPTWRPTSVPSMDIYHEPDVLIPYLTQVYKMLEGLGEKPSNQVEIMVDDFSDKQAVWSFAMLSFVRDACLVLKYLKFIPGFRELPQDVQVDLTQETVYPICLLFHAQQHPASPTFFTLTKYEEEIFLRTFPVFRRMTKHFAMTCGWISELDIDEVEVALLNAIYIIGAADKGRVPSSWTENLEELTQALLTYCDDKNPLRGGMLLAKVAEMKRCNIEHQEMALLMKQECSQLAFGVLWTEVFVQR